MSEMTIIINGHPAHVHADLARHQRRKTLLFSRQRVVYIEGIHGMSRFRRMVEGLVVNRLPIRLERARDADATSSPNPFLQLNFGNMHLSRKYNIDAGPRLI